MKFRNTFGLLYISETCGKLFNTAITRILFKNNYNPQLLKVVPRYYLPVLFCKIVNLRLISQLEWI